jgi:hypothetical protein
MGQPNTTEAWGNAALIGGLLSAKTKDSFTNGLETCDLFTKNILNFCISIDFNYLYCMEPRGKSQGVSKI